MSVTFLLVGILRVLDMDTLFGDRPVLQIYGSDDVDAVFRKSYKKLSEQLSKPISEECDIAKIE